MEFYEYLISVQDLKFFAISLTVAFRRERENELNPPQKSERFPDPHFNAVYQETPGRPQDLDECRGIADSNFRENHQSLFLHNTPTGPEWYLLLSGIYSGDEEGAGFLSLTGSHTV